MIFNKGLILRPPVKLLHSVKIFNKGLILPPPSNFYLHFEDLQHDDDDDDGLPVVVAVPGKAQAFAVYIYISLSLVHINQIKSIRKFFPPRTGSTIQLT